MTKKQDNSDTLRKSKFINSKSWGGKKVKIMFYCVLQGEPLYMAVHRHFEGLWHSVGHIYPDPDFTNMAL